MKDQSKIIEVTVGIKLWKDTAQIMIEAQTASSMDVISNIRPLSIASQEVPHSFIVGQYPVI